YGPAREPKLVVAGGIGPVADGVAVGADRERGGIAAKGHVVADAQHAVGVVPAWGHCAAALNDHLSADRSRTAQRRAAADEDGAGPGAATGSVVDQQPALADQRVAGVGVGAR